MTEKLLELLFEKFGGSLITKLVTMLATLLVSRGLMANDKSEAWVSTTAGVVFGALSIWISHRREQAKQTAIQTALMTPPPAPMVTPDQNVTAGGGVGMGNTNIGKGAGIILAAFLFAGSVNAQDVTTNIAPVVADTATNAFVNPVVQLAKAIYSVSRAGVGYGINLHGKNGAVVMEQMDVFGYTFTNKTEFALGVVHQTLFIPTVNETEVGLGLAGSWENPPRLLKYALFNATHVRWSITVCEPVEVFSQYNDFDWKRTTFGGSITRKF